MYQQAITTASQALCHLFFHCCLQDGAYTEEELKLLSDKMVRSGLNQQLNFKEEMITYRSYFDSIQNNQEYITFLVDKINPAHKLALYSYCLELFLSNNILEPKEEALSTAISQALQLTATDAETVKTVMLQRRAAEVQKQF